MTRGYVQQRALIGALVGAFALLYLGATSSPAGAACTTTWSRSASPTPTSGGALQGVAALSATNAWAVGGRLIEHWNGTSWTIVPSPAVAGASPSLQAVAGVSASDVWAVGTSFNRTTGNARTLVEHWNGTSWTVVPSPNVTGSNNFLNAIAVVSATNIWAVGQTTSRTTGVARTLTLRWNGTTWAIVASPTPAGKTVFLEGVAASSASNVWAVGHKGPSSGPGRPISKTFIMRWNGTAWNVVASPNVGTLDNFLEDVVVLSGTSAWVVGMREATSGGTTTFPYRTLVLRWNGTAWNVVASPNVTTGRNELYGVAAMGPDNLWAAGSSFAGTSPSKTLVLHWNGASWTAVPTPSPGTGGAFLNDVAVRPTGQAWAVGSFEAASTRTLVIRACGLA